MRLESLRLEGIEFSYKSRVVFENLNFTFPIGQNFHVTGAAASGRSSFLKILAAILMPQKGAYFLNGVNISDLTFEEFAPYRKMIGYSFDFGGLLANRTLAENLLLPLMYHGDISAADARARVEASLRIFNLGAHADQRPAEVPGSMRKACVVARSMIHDPCLLLLDDPFVGLSQQQGEAVVEEINRQKENCRLQQVLFTSSDNPLSKRLDAIKLQVSHGAVSVEDLSLRKVAG